MVRAYYDGIRLPCRTSCLLKVEDEQSKITGVQAFDSVTIGAKKALKYYDVEGLDESQSPQLDLLADGNEFSITVQTSSLVGTTVYMEILLEAGVSLSNSVEV